MDEHAESLAKRSRQDEGPLKIIHISELKRNGLSKYFSRNGANTQAIYNLFNKFGRVQKVQYSHGRYQYCCIIKFEDDQTVAELLEKRWLKIDGSTLQMRHISAFNQSTSDQNDGADYIDPLLLQPLPAQDSPNNIVNALNDHCLGEIFRRIDHLADFDSIANVCVRFNQIAKLVFPSKIRSRCIDFEDLVFDDNTSSFDRTTLSQLEHFLSNFGPSIVSLKFSPFYLEKIPTAINSVFKMIHKYCKNLRYFDVPIASEQDEIADEIRSIFSKLTKLHIHLSNSDPVSDFISQCTELQELEIQGLSRSFRMPNVAFLNLTKFKFHAITLALGVRVPPSLKQFLAKNLQIEEIEIIGNLVDSELMEFISQNMLNLKKMNFPSYYNR